MASFGSKLRNGGVALLILVLFPATVFAQDTSRQTFTWNKPANFITFNSIIDNPSIGDERNFVEVRDIGDSNLTDQMAVRDGQEIVLQIYFDNDAGANLKLKAKNTRARVTLPSAPTKSATITGYLTADNTKPTSVSDTAALSSDKPFSLSYENGSAQIWNNVLRGASLADSIVSSDSALIGYDKIDGVIQSGPQYSGYVTLKFKVNTQKASTVTGTKVPNSGPGDVAALFFVVAILAAAIHHKWLAVRLNP
jgi:hypothetical protein